jgi:hypothetical protein
MVALLTGALALIAASAPAAGDRHETGLRSSLRSSGLDASSPEASTPPADTLFVFHSAFWLNLHHFLYEQAVFAAGDSTRRMARHATPVTLDPLSGYERSVWKSAVAFYQDSVIDRSLLFNRLMGELDGQLGALDREESVEGQLGWRNLETVLDEAASIYATYWWPEHDKANRQHIAALEPLIARFGQAIAADQSAVFQVPWPEQPIRVDIVEFANWAGAYTRTEPTRILVSSTEGRGDPYGNLETVFHEAGHGMIGRTRGPVSEAAARAFTEAGREPPRSLWHPLLFYTVGVIVGDHLEAAGVGGFVPYADLHGLYGGEWAKPHELVVLYWPAYMAGETTLDATVEKIAADW